jgi:CRP/FNR family transcriptional regulator, cyclic AMP receptor protein
VITVTDKPILEILRVLRFLQGIAEEELVRIASVAQVQGIPAGTALFRQGETLPYIFVVVEGSVALELRVPGRGATRIHTIGPGELIGWSPLLSELPMTATARALLPTRVVAINAAQVLALCHHDPQFGFTLMQRTAQALATRLDATRLQLLDVYRHEMPAVVD